MTKAKIKTKKGTERRVKNDKNIYEVYNRKGNFTGFSVKVGNVRVHAPGQTRGTFDTIWAARQARDNYIARKKDGIYSQCNKTLNEVFSELYVKGVDTGKKRLTTQLNHKNYYFNYIEPILGGNRMIRDFIREDIKDLRKKIMNAKGVKSGKPLAQGSKREILAFAFRIFHFALHEEYIDNDICKGIDMPPAVDAKRECLTPEQIHALTTEVNRWFPLHLNLYAGFYLILETGARVGEVCGIRWCDVDLDHSTLYINQQINFATGKPSETKTPQSVRNLYITDTLYNALRNVLDYRKKTGIKVKDTDYIITPSKYGYTGKNIGTSTFRNSIMALARRCGITITPKTFRKTTGTIYADKYGPMVAAKQLGHKTTKMIETVYADPNTIYRNAFPLMGKDRRNLQIACNQ